MNCPVCKDATLSISTREGIEIDHCPQCRGVWLDRGELDKIIERSAQFVASPAAERQPYQTAPMPGWEDDRRYKRKKKRSFLDDIFDFD
ncbi:MAG: zf-TFIIB domain-containing protein [Acidimicrobiia bacterium]